VDALFAEIIKGLIQCKKTVGKIESIGVDTWAVDYVLLDDEGNKLGPVFAYRDHRTDETMDKVFAKMDAEKIYSKTGIQFQQFNTLYQLFEHIQSDPEIIRMTDSLLMIPDYINYRLSGVKSMEFTNATSTQLYNANTGMWDEDLLQVIGVSSEIFPKVHNPGTILGELNGFIRKATGFNDVKIIAPATHDTGSAVAAVPAISKDFAYISSGTWSLMGIERSTSICTPLARSFNFTNEGGVYDTYRILKNIMGLWMFQEVKKSYKDLYTFSELTTLAIEAEPFVSLIDPNDPRFLNPENMVREIQHFCEETGQVSPKSPGEIGRCIFESLAFGYRQVLDELRLIQEDPISRIHIVGGGTRNQLLNQLCADFTGCDVYAGPDEATAIGNVIVQMIATGHMKDLEEGRKIINESFDIRKYSPIPNATIEENWEKYRRLCHGN
jgi:rhamnulokinase